MIDRLKIPQKLRKKIDRELEPGERIEWVEQPIPRFLTTSSIGQVLFGIPWTGFAIFWMWGALGFKLPDFSKGWQFENTFALFGIPFVLIGLSMLLSPLWVWLVARNTVYLITDRRSILMQGGWMTTIRSYFPDRLKDIYRKERNDGTGDVILDSRNWQDRNSQFQSEDIGFLGIRDPKKVEKLLTKLSQNDSF